MWFLLNPPKEATIQVESVDDFKWLNASYCPVLHQLESESMKARAPPFHLPPGISSHPTRQLSPHHTNPCLPTHPFRCLTGAPPVITCQEYYFKSGKSQVADSQFLKYRNPKYLSMLNHLRFYLPEVYPALHKILFVDDDIVVQEDLTPLWEVGGWGMGMGDGGWGGVRVEGGWDVNAEDGVGVLV